MNWLTKKEDCMSKRDTILEAALELFIKQGFEKTPTSAISKTAGVATGTLFHHFKTKEDLISALYLDIKLNLQNLLITSINQEALTSPDNMNGDFIKDTFHKVWFSMISWTLANPCKFKFLTQFSDSAHINTETRERVENAFSEWTTLFEKGQALGIFSHMPSDLLVSLATNHMFTSCEYLLNNPDLWKSEAFQMALFHSCWVQLNQHTPSKLNSTIDKQQEAKQ
jgi:AcrR family transcriptional regulator